MTDCVFCRIVSGELPAHFADLPDLDPDAAAGGDGVARRAERGRPQSAMVGL